jgi:UDP:flavonoid glycosyltransferase YjiC (YdhE family)
LGAGRGHAVRTAALATGLIARGHQVRLYARDLRTLTSCVPENVRVLPAPHNDWIGDLGRAPAAWGDILYSEVGLHDAAQTGALLRAWCDVIDESGLDIVVADGAPLALAAARVRGCRGIAIGTGFLVPPAGPPWPAFRDWEAIDRTHVAAIEQRVVEHFSQAVGGAAGCEALGGDRALLFTRADLDHYPERGNAHYVGALLGAGVAPAWPATGPRVFVYLQPHYPRWAELLAALAARSIVPLCYAGGAMIAAGTNARFTPAALDMRAVLGEADLVIGHGGNLAVLCADAGVPAFWLPIQAEMYITARRAAALGIARLISPFDPVDFCTPIDALLAGAMAQDCRHAIADDQARIDACCSLILDA